MRKREAMCIQGEYNRDMVLYCLKSDQCTNLKLMHVADKKYCKLTIIRQKFLLKCSLFNIQQVNNVFFIYLLLGEAMQSLIL